MLSNPKMTLEKVIARKDAKRKALLQANKLTPDDEEKLSILDDLFRCPMCFCELELAVAFPILIYLDFPESEIVDIWFDLFNEAFPEVIINKRTEFILTGELPDLS